jgi:hypothetical protein
VHCGSIYPASATSAAHSYRTVGSRTAQCSTVTPGCHDDTTRRKPTLTTGCRGAVRSSVVQARRHIILLAMLAHLCVHRTASKLVWMGTTRKERGSNCAMERMMTSYRSWKLGRRTAVHQKNIHAQSQNNTAANACSPHTDMLYDTQ